VLLGVLAFVAGGAVGVNVPNEGQVPRYVTLFQLTRTAIDRARLSGPPVTGPGEVVRTNVGGIEVPMTVVPEGDCLVGDFEHSTGYPLNFHRDPARQATLPAFRIDTYEVTWAQYDACVAAGRCPVLPGRAAVTRTDEPVTGVTWEEAAGFCAFAGKRLPTGDEWEKAGRGTDGRKFPWGDEDAPPEADDPRAFARLAPVAGTGAADVSPYGVVGMVSNVGEWVAGECASDESDAPKVCSVAYDGGVPRGPSRMVRGAPWDANWCQPYVPGQLLWHFCHPTNTRSTRLGFRCAADAAASAPASPTATAPARPGSSS
jgi:formylglycine-generating enzyme required for sulfatase activity